MKTRHFSGTHPEFLLAYFIATHQSALRSEALAFYKQCLGKDQVNTTATISKHAKYLRDSYSMRITWSSKTGYKIRDWGMLNGDRFLHIMAKKIEAAGLH